uniref:high mobility group protein B2-like isoform X1 n=2 Tax=Myxine glutinosa TaxID=7769 RepID=UPI00358E1061
MYGGKRSEAIMGKNDPTKPRGKMTSYACFVHICRDEHKKKHPDVPVNFTEFSKRCSERWKVMSSKEKGRFEEMARVDKARYEREMQNYVPPKGMKRKQKKDPNAPKRPPSAFFVFCSEHRPKVKQDNPGLGIGSIAKKLGEQWGMLTPDGKTPYEKQAGKLKEKYERDVADYHRGNKAGAGGAAASKAKQKVEEDDEDEDEEEDDDDEDD